MDSQSQSTTPYGAPVRSAFGGQSSVSLRDASPSVNGSIPEQPTIADNSENRTTQTEDILVEAPAQQPFAESPASLDTESDQQMSPNSQFHTVDSVKPKETVVPIETTNEAQVEQPEEEQNQPAPMFEQYDEEMLFSWSAPSRPFKKRNRQYFVTVITIAILLCLILFFAGQFLPIAVVVAVAFLAYVMAVIPPQQVTYRFTTYGIRVEDDLYYWDEMSRFWYDDVYTQRVLYLEIERFPFRLAIVMSPEVQEPELTVFLRLFLLHEKPQPTAYERAAEWLQKRLPLDLES